MTSSRRSLLRTGAIGLSALLTGCQEFSGEQPDNNRATEDSTEQYSPEIFNAELAGAQYVPIVDSDAGSQAQLDARIADENGLRQIRIELQNEVEGASVPIVEKQLDGATETAVNTEFSAALLGPGSTYVEASVTDVNGNQEAVQSSSLFNPEVPGWQIDFKQTQNGEAVGNLGNYQTKRNWDNTLFNLNNRTTETIQQWHENAVYNELIQEIEHNNKYNDTIELGRLLDQTQEAVQAHQHELRAEIAEENDGGGAPEASSWNNEFAATAEEIINQFNQEAQQYQERNNGEQLTHWGYVNEVGHGTTIAYIDTENSNIEGEHPWQFVDTTSGIIAPIDKIDSAVGDFNPFTMGYQSQSQTQLGYETEKTKAIDALQSFAIHEGTPENYEWNKFGSDDQILDHIFNEHVPDGGSVNPIEKMMEKEIDSQMATEDYIVAVKRDDEEIRVTENEYGEEVFDGINFYTGDEQLYQMSTNPEIDLTQETVANFFVESAS